MQTAGHLNERINRGQFIARRGFNVLVYCACSKIFIERLATGDKNFRLNVEYLQTTHCQAMADIERLTLQLSQPQSMRVLLSSQSPATLSLLSNMLNGFHVETVTSVTEARAVLQDVPAKIFDVIVIDEQSEDLISDIAMFIKSSPTLSLNHTMIVHLYTPTTNSFGRTIDSTLGLSIIKLTKPPRTARLLNTLASIRNLPTIKGPGATTDVSKAMDDLAAAQRTLYGNVLIAEGAKYEQPSKSALTDGESYKDNEIAQTLLVKQLQKLDLNVTATNNGEEALQGLYSDFITVII